MAVHYDRPENQKERPPMKKYTQMLGEVIQIDETKIQDHLRELARRTVEETLNELLDAGTDQLCNGARYERIEGRRDTGAGHHVRKLKFSKAR
jgi:hypothetical protein